MSIFEVTGIISVPHGCLVATVVVTSRSATYILGGCRLPAQSKLYFTTIILQVQRSDEKGTCVSKAVLTCPMTYRVFLAVALVTQGSTAISENVTHSLLDIVINNTKLTNVREPVKYYVADFFR